MPLAGLIDIDKERERLEKETARLEKIIAGTRAKLANEKFIHKAPADVVERERNKVENNQVTLVKVKATLAVLMGKQVQ